MAVMSIAEAWPAAGRPFTVADLDRMPDDGHRYELLDGIDLGRKKTAYEQFGVPAFWVVDPRVKKPSLTVFELADGCYQQAAQVSGDEVYRAERPFPVAVTPAALVAGLITE